MVRFSILPTSLWYTLFQAMLSLVADVTFSELQKLIYQAVDVPADRQRIRVGFPPKTLDPPMEGEEGTIIPLQHGDKVAVEVLPDQKQRVQAGPSQSTGKTLRIYHECEGRIE